MPASPPSAPKGRLPTLLRVPLVALLWACVAAAAGLAVNSQRAKGLPLVAPFPYEHDCPEKLDLTTPTIDASRAWKLTLSKRLRGPGGSHGALLVDARPAELFAEGHLKGARSHPYSFVSPFSPSDAKKLLGFAHVFVYCDSPGDRLAGVQAELMRKAGLSRVKVVKGGFAALVKAAGKAALRGKGGQKGETPTKPSERSERAPAKAAGQSAAEDSRICAESECPNKKGGEQR